MTKPLEDLPPDSLQAHAEFVRALARRLLGNGPDADDVAQDTWVTALEHPPTTGEGFRGWLAVVSRRLAFRRHRSSDRRRRREEDAARRDEAPAVVDVLARESALRSVTDAVLALDEHYRTTLLLRFYEGLDAAGIAKEMDVPIATVRSRLQRGLAQLRERLDASHDGDRRAWSVALAGFLGRTNDAPAPLATAGATLLGGKAGLWAATAVVVFGGAWLWSSFGAESPRPEVRALETAEEELRVPVPAGRPDETTARTAVAVLPPSLESGLASFSIRVAWSDGSPAADRGLEVLQWSAPISGRLQYLRTDEDGEARLDGVQPGRVFVEADVGGGLVVEAEPGREHRVEFAIPSGRDVAGVVVDAQGDPVAGASVWVSAYANYSDGMVATTSDDEGRFSLRDVGEVRDLGAFADGHSPAFQLDLDEEARFLEPDEPLEVELRLTGTGGELVGTVLSPEGEPVEHAYVHVTGPEPPEPESDRQLDVAPRETRTDSSGLFRVSGLAAGMARLHVLAPGCAPYRGAVEIPPGGTLRHEVRLATGTTVTGVVRDPGGEPVEGASVFLRERYSVLRPSARTDAEGAFQLEVLPAGVVDLGAELRGLGKDETRIQLSRSGSDTWYPVLAEGRVLRGSVVDERGEPLVGWYVKAQQNYSESWWGSAETGADGTFRILNCPERSLDLIKLRRPLELRDPLHVVSFRRVDPAAGWLEIRVLDADLPSVWFSGRVLDETGEPLGAYVVPWLEGGNGAPQFTGDLSGRFRCGPLSAGTYRISVEVEERGTVHLGNFTFAPGEERDLGDIRFEEPGTLEVFAPEEGTAFSGRVSAVDERGLPIIGSAVRYPEEMTPLELLPGSYVLQLSCSGRVASDIAFEITSGNTTILQPVFLTGSAVRFEYRWPDWIVETPARLRVRLESDEMLDAHLVLLGSRTWFEDSAMLSPGSYRLTAETETGLTASVLFTVPLQDDMDRLVVELE